MFTKLFIRLVVINIIFGWITDIIYPPLSVFSAPFEMTGGGEYIAFIWLGFTVLGSSIIWIYMLYHCGTHTFTKKLIRPIWFLIIFLGYIPFFIGPLIYYVLVYELNIGLVKNNTQVQKAEGSGLKNGQ